MMFEIKNLIYKDHNQEIIHLEQYAIEQGHHLLLLGPSGCGKTTFMNLLSGLLKASNGEISFQGQKYSDLSERDMNILRAKNFGFIFQKLHLIDHLTVIQNITLAQQKPDTKRVQALVRDLGLSGKEQQKARTLSVGEAQRVAIARAVVNNPKIIFADEPTSALDDTNTQKVMDLIFDQAKKNGATVIAATHDSRIKKPFAKIMEMAA